MDLFEGLPEDDAEPPLDAPGQSLEKVSRKLSRKEQADCVLEALTDDLYQEALGVVDDSMHFADVEPTELEPGEAPPAKWIAELGYERAARRARVARSNWMPKKDCPMGLHIAMQMMTSITHARAKQNEGPSTLNVSFVQISGPEPTYEVIDVDK